MKKNIILGFISLSVMAVSCQKNEIVQETASQNLVFLNATIGEDTKSFVADDGSFTWTNGDQMRVYTTTGRWVDFNIDPNDSGKKSAKFVGTLNDGESITGYAVYPWSYHSYDGNTLKVYRADKFGWDGGSYTRSTNTPMIAAVTEDGNLKFNHIGGVLRFNIAGVPAGTSRFVFKSNSQVVRGEYTVNFTEDGPVAECSYPGGYDLTSIFAPFGSTTDETFFVPLPEAVYNGYTIELQDKNGVVLASMTSDKTQTLERGMMARLPKLMVNGNKIVKWGNLARVDNDHLRTVTGTGSVSVSLTSPVTENRTINMVYASSKVAEYNAANGTSFLAMDASKVTVTSVEIPNGSQTGNFTYTIDVTGIEKYSDAYLVPITIDQTSLPAGVVLGEQSTVYIEVRKSIAGTYSAEYITSVYEGTGTFSNQSGYLYYGPTVYVAEGNFYDSVNQQAYYVRYHDQYDNFVLFDISDEPMEGHENCVKLTNLQDRIASPGHGHDAITSSSYFNTVTGEIVFDMWIDGYQEDKLLACKFYK